MRPERIKAELEEGKAYYIKCPYCGVANDYPARNKIGKDWWHNHGCHVCSGSYDVEKDEDGTYYVIPKNQKGMIEGYSLLKLGDDLYMLVNSSMFASHTFEDIRYYHEEHTCTENLFRSTKRVILGNNADPHRLVKYIGTLPKGRVNADTINGEEIVNTFLEFFKDQKHIPEPL